MTERAFDPQWRCIVINDGKTLDIGGMETWQVDQEAATQDDPLTILIEAENQGFDVMLHHTDK